MMDPVAATAFSVIHRGVRSGDEVLDQRLTPSVVVYVTEWRTRRADTRSDLHGKGRDRVTDLLSPLGGIK